VLKVRARSHLDDNDPVLAGSSPDHTAHFCRTEDYATGRLAAFIREGLNAGEDVLVIATTPRCARVRQTLATMAVPFEAALAGGTLVFADAEQVAAAMVADGAADPAPFDRVLAPFVQGSPRRKRIYGEVVALLTRDGHLDAALALERRGHQLAAGSQIRILCGYDVESFRGSSENAVADVAAAHHRCEFETAAHEASAANSAPVGATVLLADDYEDTRELFREYLEYCGYRVALACDGVEAVEQARVVKPDVILLDVRMPRMTGTEALRLLRASPAFAHVPIVALTAHALDSERSAIIGEGFDMVLTKPCMPDSLAHTIAFLVREHRNRTSA
jgi:CheY-like chemotaxis protein